MFEPDKLIGTMTERTETRDQLEEQLDCLSDVDNDIIDSSAISFSNKDTWLDSPIQDPSGYSVGNLYAWLKMDAEDDSNDSHFHNDSRRSIDTRTFTRPKKRSGRLNFESISEMNATQSSNVWNPQCFSSSRIQTNEESVQSRFRLRRESTPPMLRPSNPGVSGLCSADTTLTSGQESLEAFLNLSQSQGIDSFINLAEPEFSDTVMNASQSSVLYTSITSVTQDDSPQPRNDVSTTNLSETTSQASIEDSQILTDSMMQSSMFGDVTDVHFNDTLARNSTYATMLENTYCNNLDDGTFVGEPVEHFYKQFNGTFNTVPIETGNLLSMNATYTPSELNATLTNDLPLPNDPYASYIVDRKCQIIDRLAIDNTSFVVRDHRVNDTSFVVKKDTTINASFEVCKDQDVADDATCNIDILQSGDQNDTFNVQKFDATYDNTLSSRKSQINSTFETRSSGLSTTLKVSTNAHYNDTFEVQNSDAIDENLSSLSPRKSALNSPLKAPTVPSRKPSPIANPINAKSETHINHKLDITYEHNTGNDCNQVPVTNRYNTYRKVTVPEHTRNENYATNNLTTRLSNETVNIGRSLESLDATFNKPAPIVQRKLNAPRPLSRLPQTLQKSNPNLISSSLKAVNTAGRSAVPSFGFSKLARPSTARNVESSLTSKLYGLGNIKSGSEQRLQVTRNTQDFQIAGTGGSTESIDSTQSAHSAPDFDDRLSVCSDGSHTSYSMRTITIENLQKANHRHTEYGKPASTPKPSRRVLENTWIEASNDLPSPILKNGPETYESRGSSPRSVDSAVKTSSPLRSSAESLQNLTVTVSDSIKDNNQREAKRLSPRLDNNATQRISVAAVNPTRNAGENRTGLRPPASWSSTNQRPVSGIPRPASRIPAPRSLRPPTKINQGDTKKGYL